MKRIIWWSLLVVIVVGIVVYKIRKPEPGVESYRNGTYTIENVKVTLDDGRAERESAPGSASKVVTQFFGNEAFGDLNGDGTSDVAFLLTQTTGGSGAFFYIASALKKDDGYVGTNAILLGDRIAPQSTEIKDGLITVNYADRKPGEPMTTTPSQGVSKYFRIIDGTLVEQK